MNSTSKGTIPHYDLYGRVLPSTKFILWRFKLHIPKPIYLSRVPLLYIYRNINEYKSVDNRPSHSWYFIWRFKTFCAKYYILLSPTTLVYIYPISKLLFWVCQWKSVGYLLLLWMSIAWGAQRYFWHGLGKTNQKRRWMHDFGGRKFAKT